jgi:hypothetical protein
MSAAEAYPLEYAPTHIEGLVRHPLTMQPYTPEMSPTEYARLIRDIELHGLRDAIHVWEHEGRKVLLDGWHRMRACEEVGIKCRVDVFTGTPAEAVAFIESKNDIRRHVPPGERAQCAVRRAKAAGILLSQGGDRSKPPSGGVKAETIAKQQGVGVRTVERARAIEDASPVLSLAVTDPDTEKRIPQRAALEVIKGGLADAVEQGHISPLEAAAKVLARPADTAPDMATTRRLIVTVERCGTRVDLAARIRNALPGFELTIKEETNANE